MIEDFAQEGESFMKPLQGTLTILRAGFLKRAYIDFMLKAYNKGRLFTVLEKARVVSLRTFEK